MKFGEKVKIARKKMGLSQTQFGELLNVNFTTVNRWENGRNNPSYEAVTLFEKLCYEQHLFFEEDTENN